MMLSKMKAKITLTAFNEALRYASILTSTAQYLPLKVELMLAPLLFQLAKVLSLR